MPGNIIGGAPYDVDLQVDEEGYRTHTPRWRVRTNLGESSLTALYASGMPIPGAALASDVWSFYQRRGSARLLKQETDKRVWDCTTIFSNKPQKRCQTSACDNPLAETPKISGGFNRTMKEVHVDKDSKPIVNAVNEPITGIQGPDDHQTLRIDMNCAWINLPWMAQYVGAVNSDTVWGCAPRTVLCLPFTWEKVSYGACYYYYHCVFEFEYKSSTWDEEIVNCGNLVLIAGTTPPKFRRAKDAFENTIKVLLDSSGNQVSTPELISPKPRVKKELAFAIVGWPAFVP